MSEPVSPPIWLVLVPPAVNLSLLAALYMTDPPSWLRYLVMAMQVVAVLWSISLVRQHLRAIAGRRAR